MLASIYDLALLALHTQVTKHMAKLDLILGLEKIVRRPYSAE